MLRYRAVSRSEKGGCWLMHCSKIQKTRCGQWISMDLIQFNTIHLIQLNSIQFNSTQLNPTLSNPTQSNPSQFNQIQFITQSNKIQSYSDKSQSTPIQCNSSQFNPVQLIPKLAGNLTKNNHAGSFQFNSIELNSLQC